MVLECIKNLFKKKERVTILEDSIQLNNNKVVKFRLSNNTGKISEDTVVEIKFSRFIEIVDSLKSKQKELDELKERVE